MHRSQQLAIALGAPLHLLPTQSVVAGDLERPV
jgi:hypothetical protein